jgi:hypothetical protein
MKPSKCTSAKVVIAVSVIIFTALLTVIAVIAVMAISGRIPDMMDSVRRRAYPIEYEDIIIEASNEFSVPPERICAVICAESKFDKNAKSSAGAIGLMQIIPETFDDVQKYMNRDMLQAGSDAKMAELVAQEIYDIRESRDALLRGEADNTPKDGQQLKLMLDGLEEQIKTLSSLFVGTKEVSEVTYVKDIVPNATTEKFVAFRFSKWSGLVDSDDMSGAPYYISIEKMGDLPEPSEDVKIAAQKGKMLTAVRYNVPARTKTKVYNAEKTFVEFEYPIAQFGYEEILSNILFAKKATTNVTFFQHTGGIKNIKEGSAQ